MILKKVMHTLLYLQETIRIQYNNGYGCDKPKAEEPFDYMILLNITLGILNLLMIYSIFDLALILKGCGGRESSQRPKLDYLVCGFKWIVHLFLHRIFYCTKGKQQQQRETDDQLWVTYDCNRRANIWNNKPIRNRHSVAQMRP